MESLKRAKHKTFNFKQIDLMSNLDIAINFRTDAFACSFEHPETRWGNKDVKEYIAWLEAKFQSDPDSVVHVWLGQTIVGQMELGESKHDQNMGYVYLYYLIPDMRGTSASGELHHYALNYLRKKNYKLARLSVSKANLRAIHFYSRLGWYSVGDRPDDSDVLVMEIVL